MSPLETLIVGGGLHLGVAVARCVFREVERKIVPKPLYKPTNVMYDRRNGKAPKTRRTS